MRICLIAKYPPIEGGEAAKTYWLAKALGEANHEIHIITNAYEVEDIYREKIIGDDLNSDYQPKGVHVHSTDPFTNLSHIPYSKPYTEKLASLAIDIIREYNLQLIDSWYVLPYVISGFLAKTITNKSQIIRHAGSDITRLFNSPYLHTLFYDIFKNADRIVTYPSMRKKFETIGINEEKLFYNRHISVDTKAFNPKVNPIDLSPYTRKNQNRPIITYIGKIGTTKGIYELVKAASLIKKDFLLLFLTNGENVDKFKKFTNSLNINNKVSFIGFLPPWKIPSVIKKSRCVVIPEREFPIKEHTPILPREVMAVGKCLILSEEIYSKRIVKDMEDGRNVIVINPKKIDRFKEALEKIIAEPDYAKKIGQQALIASQKTENFISYIKDTINLYKEVLKVN